MRAAKDEAAPAAEIKEDSEMAPTEADVTEEDDGIYMIFVSFFFFLSHIN